jgi:hypothetical protein
MSAYEYDRASGFGSDGYGGGTPAPYDYEGPRGAFTIAYEGGGDYGVVGRGSGYGVPSPHRGYEVLSVSSPRRDRGPGLRATGATG